tara:strand:+ start:1333 stop:1755 length:423 start_codon:yes stop_codon:yes gene_type:complete
MKINFYILFLYLFSFSRTFSGELVIKILNIEENTGSLHFAIYDNPEFFPKEEGKKIGFKKTLSEIVNNEVIINDLEESKYAVAIYHDENDNNKFDTIFAIPQEKFGFSNDAKIFFGPPSFDEASFYLKKNERLKIEISLR